MIVTLPTFVLWIFASLIPSLKNINFATNQVLYATIYANKKVEAWSHREQILTGLAISSDRGTTWKSIGWKNTPTNDFCIDPKNEKNIYLACDNGILKTTDSGLHWKLMTPWNMTFVKQIKISPLNPDRIYAGTAKGFFISDDAGNTWRESSDGLSIPNGTFISCIVLPINSDKNIFLATEDGLYQSSERGERWTQSGLKNIAVRSLHQHPKQTKVWLAGTAKNGVFVTEDNGAFWSQQNEGLLANNIQTTAIDPQNESIMYCAGPGYGMYQSTDKGMHWNLRSRGLTNFSITAICVDPSDSKRIYAGTKTGSFISTDSADRWNTFSLYWTHITSLRFE